MRMPTQTTIPNRHEDMPPETKDTLPEDADPPMETALTILKSWHLLQQNTETPALEGIAGQE